MEKSPKEIVENIKVAVDLREAVEGADYVQESVPERYDVKKKILSQVDNVTPSDTIIASSTSALKMTIIQEVVKKPERCIIVHPWNPPI